MTGKRFSVTQTILGSGIYDYQAEDELCESYDEDAYREVCNLLNELHEEKEMWKRECERLKGLYYLENENVELEDIIGLVKTDDRTNSVELKKELYK